MANSPSSYVEAAILWCLSSKSESPVTNTQSANQMRSSIGIEFNALIDPDIIALALEDLVEKGLATRIIDDLTDTYFEFDENKAIDIITDIKFSGEIGTSGYDVFRKAAKLGHNWLTEALSKINRLDSDDNLLELAEGGGLVAEQLASPEIVDGDMISALAELSDGEDDDEETSAEAVSTSDNARSGSSWGSSWGGAPASDRVVPLNHNAPDYKKVFSSLEKVIKEFREDQSFGNNPPPERDRVMGELEAGRDYIEKQAKQNGEVRFGAIREFLIEPLNWIVKTFGKEALAALAKEAIKFLFKLFGGG